MDEIRKFILDTAIDRRMDLKELSLKLGKNHAYLHQFIHRNVPKKLHPDDRATLSVLLNVPEGALGGRANAAPQDGFPLQRHLPNASVIDQKVEMGPTLPLYGSAVGGVDGQFEFNGNILDRVKAPVSLFGVKDAYAVLVAGDSMEPRYEDGETVFVNPERRPTRNDYIVAQIRTNENGPPEAYIKKLVRWNSEKLVLSQFNPVKELEFDGKLVESVHYVLRSGE